MELLSFLHGLAMLITLQAAKLQRYMDIHQPEECSLPGRQTFSNLIQGTTDQPHLDVEITSGCVVVNQTARVGVITVRAGAVLALADIAGLELSVSSIQVHGTLRLGSRESPLVSPGIAITLRGGSDHGIYTEHSAHSKGISAHAAGTIDVHGKQYTSTWSRLQATANAGADTLLVQGILDWDVDQELVVITTTAVDEFDDHQNERRNIQAVSFQAGATAITLDRPLEYTHYAGAEYQGEVALLSRSVTIQGDEHSYKHSFGGHTMCMLGSTCRFSYVRGFRLGQKNVMGRYPFHFHLMGAVGQTSYATGVTVQDSFFRAFTLHAVSNMSITHSVAFNITGNAVYLEDGVEEHNVLAHNLVAHVHPIAGFGMFIKGPKVDSWMKDETRVVAPLPDQGVWYTPVPERVMPADLFAAPFYCLNPNNRWIGNVASGGWTGFMFPSVPAPLGLTGKQKPALRDTYVPTDRSILEFDGNTAHSSGHQWDFGSCIYFGGAMKNDNPDNSSHYMYNPARDSGEYFRPHLLLNNTLTYACRIGLVVWGTTDYVRPQVTVSGHRSHDSLLGFRLLAHSAVLNTTFGGRTANSAAFGPGFVWDSRDFGAETGGVMGLSFYDTILQTLVSNSTCLGFDKSLDFCFMNPEYYLSQFPTGQSAVSDILFKSTTPSHRLKLARGGSAKVYCHSSHFANVVDSDGSLTGLSAGMVLGATDPPVTTCKSNNWWLLDGEQTCVKNFTEWDGGYWACPLLTATAQRRLVVSIVLMQGRTFQGTAVQAVWNGQPIRKKAQAMIVKQESNLIKGFLHHFGHHDRRVELGNAPYDKDSAWQVAGACCDIGWYLNFTSGPPKLFTIALEQMGSGGLVFAIQYFTGFSPKVFRMYGWGADREKEKLSAASNKNEFLGAPGNQFYVEDSVLFLKLVNQKAVPFASGGNLQTANLFWGTPRYEVTITNHGKDGGVAEMQMPANDWIPSSYTW